MQVTPLSSSSKLKKRSKEALERSGCCTQVVAMLTQTEVDPHDPAFKEPTKFIGPCYTKQEAEKCVHTAPSPTGLKSANHTPCQAERPGHPLASTLCSPDHLTVVRAKVRQGLAPLLIVLPQHSSADVLSAHEQADKGEGLHLQAGAAKLMVSGRAVRGTVGPCRAQDCPGLDVMGGIPHCLRRRCCRSASQPSARGAAGYLWSWRPRAA